MYGVNVICVNCLGMDIFVLCNLILQVGDCVMVVGFQDVVECVVNLMGNLLKCLDYFNIVIIFVGIFLGIFFGSLFIVFLGIFILVKLGLVGGLLIVFILIGCFGYKLKLVIYIIMSVNLMLCEIGIVLFFVSVGIKVGVNFVNMVVDGDGLLYVGCGFFIIVIFLLIMGVVVCWYYKMNYFMLMGFIVGSNIDFFVLVYFNQIVGNNVLVVGYFIVYLVFMFFCILIV